MPRENQNSSEKIVLGYAKVIQESFFGQLRVVRDVFKTFGNVKLGRVVLINEDTCNLYWLSETSGLPYFQVVNFQWSTKVASAGGVHALVKLVRNSKFEGV